MDTGFTENRNTDVSLQNDSNAFVEMLTNDIITFLKHEVEESGVPVYKIKEGLSRALHRVISALKKKNEKIVVFPDSIPGFTLLILKKSDLDEIRENAEGQKRNPVSEAQSADAVQSVMSRFFKKNKRKVLVVNSPDMSLSLFPLADTKQTLIELGLSKQAN